MPSYLTISVDPNLACGGTTPGPGTITVYGEVVIWVTAYAKANYVFTGWTGSVPSSDVTISLRIRGSDNVSYSVTAHFQPSGPSPPPPECQEGQVQVLEWCPDGLTWKSRRVCIGGRWNYQSQVCPGVSPEPTPPPPAPPPPTPRYEVTIQIDDGLGHVVNSLEVEERQQVWFKGRAGPGGKVDVYFDQYTFYPPYKYQQSIWIATVYANSAGYWEASADKVWLQRTGANYWSIVTSKRGTIWTGPVQTDLGFKAESAGVQSGYATLLPKLPPLPIVFPEWPPPPKLWDIFGWINWLKSISEIIWSWVTSYGKWVYEQFKIFTGSFSLTLKLELENWIYTYLTSYFDEAAKRVEEEE